MIRPPQRAVTRFLIPFIDVLILLFCIFLLMPFVSRSDDAKAPSSTTATQPDERARLEQELKEANERLEKYRKDRAGLFEQFRVTVLEIDKDNGELYFNPFNPTGRELPPMRLQDNAAAARFIDREKALAGDRTAAFQIRFPRELSPYPTREQLDLYRTWFKNVPLKVDIVTSIPAAK